MTVYFDHTIRPPDVTASLEHAAVEWHPRFSLLAVAFKNASTDADGAVSFYLDEVRTRGRNQP